MTRKEALWLLWLSSRKRFLRGGGQNAHPGPPPNKTGERFVPRSLFLAKRFRLNNQTEALRSAGLVRAKRFIFGGGKTTKRLGLFPPRPGTRNQRSQPKRFGRNKAIRPKRFPSCHCDRRSAGGSDLQSPTGHQKGKRFPSGNGPEVLGNWLLKGERFTGNGSPRTKCFVLKS